MSDRRGRLPGTVEERIGRRKFAAVEWDSNERRQFTVRQDSLKN